MARTHHPVVRFRRSQQTIRAPALETRSAMTHSASTTAQQLSPHGEQPECRILQVGATGAGVLR